MYATTKKAMVNTAWCNNIISNTINSKQNMSLYNILTLETRNYSSSSGWDTNSDLYKINLKQSYDFNIIEHNHGNHVYVVEPSLQPPPQCTDRFSASMFIDSSSLSNKSNLDTKSSIFANLIFNPDISLARPGRPIHNSAPGWRYNKK